MLQSLHVHNFALLEDAHADFTAGFNVFTGETGAGKSILIDAFGMVLGGRASADYVRSGTDGLWVQAVFDISGRRDIKALLVEHGIDAEDDLFLKRQLSATGKSRAFINGVQVPLNIVRQLSSVLVDIHGQHENQALLKQETPRLLTDAYGGDALHSALIVYQDLYKEYMLCKQNLESLQAANEKQDLLLDRYAWEIQEIENASLKIGEETGLEEEARLLQNSERIIKSVDRSYNYLDADEGILAQLAGVRDELQYAARYDAKLKPLAEGVDSAWISLDDCRTELSSYLAGSEFNAERAAQVQERLDTIYRLQKKYGGTTEAVLNYLAVAQEKLEQLENIAANIAKAKKALEQVTAKLTEAAAVLTSKRQQSSKELAIRITEHIHDLAMPNGVFAIKIEASTQFTPYGCDVLRFLFTANMGEPLNDLEKVASGGELSRIALALKTVMMYTGTVGTMVFDEIDTGVGGITAQRMAEKIAAISTVGQVLCITHLPQIAAFADNHIHIEKRSADGRTATVLSILDYNARLQELVRMTAGDSTSLAAYESAAELLQSAQAVKNKLQQDKHRKV